MDLAISIRQPYTELILLGHKTEEYRRYPTNVRGRVMLYATKKVTEITSGLQQARKLGIDLPQLPMGMIVGSVEIYGCRDIGDGDFAYLLRNPTRYAVPWKAMGHPQPCFWRPII